MTLMSELPADDTHDVIRQDGQAVAWSCLRAGRYRVFYTIDEERQIVQLDHVARLP